MKLVLYKSEYRDDLEEMMKEFSQEVYGIGTANVDMFVEFHYAIYLAIMSGEVVGFTSFNVNSTYGMDIDSVNQDFIYIKPKHRRSKALHLMSIQAGLIARDLNMPLEHYVATEASTKLTTRWLKGKKMFVAYRYPVDEILRVADRLMKKVKVKQ